MFEIFAATDIGRRREQNEDSFLINDYVASSGEKQVLVDGDFVVAVADGVGGEKAGEIASNLALEEFVLIKPSIANEELSAFILGIHEKINAYGKTHGESKGLGTTIAGIICRDDKVTVFHVGDSRVYRFRDGYIKRLTKDHSLVQVLFDSGQINREEMFAHPQSNVILQYLGASIKSIEVEVETIRADFEIGDMFIVCSDGLSDMVQDAEIESIISNSSTLPDAVNGLVKRANENGGNDNVTVIGVRKVDS